MRLTDRAIAAATPAVAPSGDRLSVGSTTATVMACSEGMKIERAFLDPLGRVRGWRITGRLLQLLDATDNLVARFEGRHMG